MFENFLVLISKATTELSTLFLTAAAMWITIERGMDVPLSRNLWAWINRCFQKENDRVNQGISEKIPEVDRRTLNVAVAVEEAEVDDGVQSNRSDDGNGQRPIGSFRRLFRGKGAERKIEKV